MDSLDDVATSKDFGVSVIIPCYNYADYIGEAIESVLNQDYKNYELIVIDDGSTDNTPEVLKLYSDRIRYIRQENQGLSATRNNGIKLSQNKFITFLDADDRWEVNFLSEIMQEFQRQSQDVALVACLDSKIDKNGVSLPDRAHHSKLGELSTKDLILKNRFFPGAAIIRKQVFKELGGFDQNLKSSEDRDMWIRISCHYKVWLIGDRLIQIRKHGENMSSNAKRMEHNKQEVINKCYIDNVIDRRDIAFWLQVKSILNYQVSWIFYNQGERLSAIRSLLKSLMLWPLMIDNKEIDVPVLFRLRALIRFFFVSDRKLNE